MYLFKCHRLIFFYLHLVFLAKNQLEFGCHMLRGAIDPKQTAVYEYVKFIGNFKSLNNGEAHMNTKQPYCLCIGYVVMNIKWVLFLSHLCLNNCKSYRMKSWVGETNKPVSLSVFGSPLVPNATKNGLEGVLRRSLHPAFDDQVCFVATVRLAKPQFIKVRRAHTHTRYTDRHTHQSQLSECLCFCLCEMQILHCVCVCVSTTGDVYSGGAQWGIHIQAQLRVEIPLPWPQVTHTHTSTHVFQTKA